MSNFITSFYQAFQSLDAESMVSHYHEDIHFEDPAFGMLRGERAKNMWRMLIENQKGKDFKVSFGDVIEDENGGTAKWEAWYNFSRTGRKVHNIIHAQFEKKDGKIIKHIDHFDLYRWSRQALGLQGKLIGWSGFFKRKLNTLTNRLLDKYESRQ